MKKYLYYYHPSGNLEVVIPQALDHLKWNYKQNGSVYTVEFGINLFTWGMIMEIKMINSHQCNVSIRTAFLPQIWDWGEGNRRINEFIESLQHTN